MPKIKQKTNEEFIAGLKSNPAYAHIDIDFELAKATTWCEVNNRQCTQRFFVNWINRIEKPLRPMSRFDRDADCGTCESTRHVIVNDHRSPCPRCRPAEEKAY